MESDHITYQIDLERIRSEVAPMYWQYPCEIEPQAAHLELDCETGEVQLGRASAGNGVPEAVWYRRTRRYEIPADASGSALADCLESPEMTLLLERIYLGVEIEWNGRNFVGSADDDAKTAEDDLTDLLGGLSDQLANIWLVGQWLSSNSLEDYWDGQPLAEAVRTLQASARDEQVHVIGSIEQELLERAQTDFNGYRPVSSTHVEALLEHGYISEAEAESWRDQPEPELVD